MQQYNGLRQYESPQKITLWHIQRLELDHELNCLKWFDCKQQQWLMDHKRASPQQL